MMKEELFKTNLATDLNSNFQDTQIKLNGWVHKRRDHGGIIFIDLRDSSGIIQLVFNAETKKEVYTLAETLRNEFVIAVKGTVKKRSQETINPDLPTGEIEVIVDTLVILNASKPIPFSLDDYDQTNEEVRLTYRFLDLRKPKVKEAFYKRAKMNQIMRNFLADEGFTELETPILSKATPEGARDFLVPSRINPGQFYALPQSPQMFKQLFMLSGFNGYFQIARCFRDEDLRADRQPEFTQLDIEMSFAYQERIMEIIERLFQKILKDLYQIDIKLPIAHITYQDAMENYGIDRPDLRFEYKLKNIDAIAQKCEFDVFKNALAHGGIVRGINIKGKADLSRKDIETYTNYVATFGAKGLATFKVTENGLESNIEKYFTKELLTQLQKTMEAQKGDLLVFVADKPSVTYAALGNLRNKLAQDLNLIKNKDELNFVWVVDFPLFEWSDTEQRFTSTHHPFTSPQDSDVELLKQRKLGEVKAQAYDLVLNGIEIGGGSIRIHDSSLQEEIFSILGLSEKEINDKFGFFVRALQYGTPPHGGIAFGIDRVIMMLEKLTSIRDVIAFPKTQKGLCLLTESPSSVSQEQLKEAHIKIDNSKL
jgi:aspartyl-tRNA synthetase